MHNNKLKQIFRKVNNQFKEKNWFLGIITNINTCIPNITLTLK